MTRTQAYWRLTLILLVYFALSLAHSLWLPLAQAPDEIDHFRYTLFIAQHSRLPLSYEERETAGNKAYLPALYHSLNAALVGWSSSDVPPLLKFVFQSPRSDLVQALFHTQYFLNTEDEFAPYRGNVLMWHLGRGVSIVLALGVIVVSFFTALEIFPKKYNLALVAAAITAFVPTFIFITSSISYEVLVALLTGLYFPVLVKIVKRDAQPTAWPWGRYILLGLLLGLSVTVKYAAVILPVQVMAVVAYLAWRRGWGWWGWFKRVVLTGLAAMVASSWWFIFLMVNFNQIDQYGLVVGLLKPVIAGGTDTSQNVTAFFLTGGKIGYAGGFNPPPFSAWVWRTFESFWVEKIGYYPLGVVPHLLMGLVCLVAVLGLVKTWQRRPASRIWIGLLVSHFLFFLVFPFLRYIFQGELSHTAQGRHVLFPVATAFPLLLIYGWQSLSIRAQRWLALALVGGLVGWSLAQLVHVTACCTAPLPIRTTSEATPNIPHRLDQPFGPHLVLLGHDTQLAPETGALRIRLYWQSPTYPDEDYLMTVTLVQDGEPKLQWEAYPTNGRYPTRIWENWETIRDDLELPLFNLPPGDYEVQLQLRGAYQTLPVNGGDTLVLGRITIPPIAAPAPTVPLSISVDGREVVRGLTLWQTDAYQKLDQLEYRPRMAIPFVWQGQTGPTEQVKWLLVADDGQAYPARQASLQFEYFMVGPDFQPGPYRLRAEVWRDGAVIASQETAPLLTVFNKQPRLMEPPPVPYPFEANFANRIKLLGYDLPLRSLTPGQGIPITLYWQGLRTMEHDYTFFIKLLDDRRQQWSSRDRYAKDGYKTTHWLENEVVVDSFELPTDPAMPAGIYWLNVGLYLGLDQSTIPLPLMAGDQPGEVTSVTFGPVKIGGPPPGIVVTDASPEHSLDAELGNAIRLLGYDVGQSQETLTLKLYWQSIAPLATDQTVFLHVRNQNGEVVAQVDRPPTGEVYPTSLWEPGEIIPDEIQLALPASLPPGDYTIATGMYNFATGARLPVAGSTDDSIILFVVEGQ
ncbi:MAG: hypothetical protein JW953_15880 [Anaerolineae bacterium]|nr:hypothetical protein [Anaerolineae bacterium]